jgi:hypothetical protein
MQDEYNMRGSTYIYFNFPFLRRSVNPIDGGFEFHRDYRRIFMCCYGFSTSAKVAVVVLSDVGRSLG